MSLPASDANDPAASTDPVTPAEPPEHAAAADAPVATPSAGEAPAANPKDDKQLPPAVVAVVLGAAALIAAFLLVRTPAPTRYAGDTEETYREDNSQRGQSSPRPEAAANVTPLSPAAQLFQDGQAAYIDGRVSEAIDLFDRQIELQPEDAPHHWQRGIALYQAGRYAEGAEQFAAHQTVNQNDTENAAFHLLCVARSPGQTLESAREQLLPIDTDIDRRVPMPQLYALYAGTGSEEAVFAAVENAARQQQLPAAYFARLYVGLLQEVEGRTDEAAEHLKTARDLPLFAGPTNVMGHVAAVHLKTTKLRETPAGE